MPGARSRPLLLATSPASRRAMMRHLHLMLPARAGVRRLTTSRPFAPRICSSALEPVLPRPTWHRPPPPAPRFHRQFSQTTARRRKKRQRDPPRRRDPYEELDDAEPLFDPEIVLKVIRSPILHAAIVLWIAGAVAYYYANLETVPVSGRQRFNCYTEAEVRAAGEEQARRIEYEVEESGGRFLADWDPWTLLVKRVMKRLIPVSGMEDLEWEVHVIDDPHTANAFILPGGKVFVFSGLIPIARNEHGLATALGHEIAHNLADHVGERMSSQLGLSALWYSLIVLTGGLAIIVSTYLGHFMLDLVFERPMGRRQEAEADFIGLMMMAEACYDPREAVSFWERMKQAHDGEPPEWMSTHPSNANRIQKIQEWMPKALDKMHESDCHGTASFADMFKRALLSGDLILWPRGDI